MNQLAEELRWSLAQGREGLFDCLMTKNRPEVGLQRGIELSTMSNRCTNLKGLHYSDDKHLCENY